MLRVALLALSVRALRACTDTLPTGLVPLKVPSAGWVVPPQTVVGCEDPEQCTAVLPSQIMGGAVLSLTLSQRRCFTSEGDNWPDCCDGIVCASWAGAALHTAACMDIGVFTVHATLGDGPARATVGGMEAAVGGHRYAFIRTPGWSAVTVDGALVSNSTGTTVATQLGVTITAAGGSSPTLSFTALPPGVPSGTPARFSVGAGAVRDGTAVLHTNTLRGVTVVVPEVAQGECAPCAMASSAVSTVFHVDRPATAAVTFDADAMFTITSIAAASLTDAAVAAALTPVAGESPQTGAPPPASAGSAAEEGAHIVARQLVATTAALQIASALDAFSSSRIMPPSPTPSVPSVPNPPDVPAAAAFEVKPPFGPPPPGVPSQPPASTATTFLQSFANMTTPPGPGPPVPPGPAPTNADVFVGAFAMGSTGMSDAHMSTLMTDAAGVPLRAVSTAGTLATVATALTDAQAQTVAAAVAEALSLPDVPYSISPTATHMMLSADVTRDQLVAMGALQPYATFVATVPGIVCITVYSSGDRPPSLGPAIAAVSTSQLMVATNDVRVTTASKTEIARADIMLIATIGIVSVAVLVSALIAVGLQVYRGKSR